MGFWTFIADFFVNARLWLEAQLLGWGVAPGWTQVLLDLAGSLVLVTLPFASILFLIWATRKIIARMQDRLGPTSAGTWAGPFALFQTVADAVKILTKELIVPQGADRLVFIIAPILVIMVSLAIWIIIPFGPEGMQGVDLDLGVFYVVALGSVTLFSMIMAGWSSRNKYADVGTFRAVSQIISYEIPQILSLMTPIMLTGSLSMQKIVLAQEVPFIVALPVPALVYFLAMTAEVGRLPFEQAEADAELVAGYFTEYSGMMFGSFYLAEFINNFSASLVFATLFLGGWRGPWVEVAPALGAVWLLLKGFAVFFVLALFWGAMPRLRIDQILGFNWKFLVPLGLVTLLVVAFVDKTVVTLGVTGFAARSLWLLLANGVITLLTIALLKLQQRRDMQRRDAQRFAPPFLSEAPQELGDL
jgi:NADH-quinone oxidoreductase subunit H